MRARSRSRAADQAFGNANPHLAGLGAIHGARTVDGHSATRGLNRATLGPASDGLVRLSSLTLPRLSPAVHLAVQSPARAT